MPDSDWEVLGAPPPWDDGPTPGPSPAAKTLRKTEDLEVCMQTMMASQCTLIERYKELSGKIDALGRMIHELKTLMEPKPRPKKRKAIGCDSKTSPKSLLKPKG